MPVPSVAGEMPDEFVADINTDDCRRDYGNLDMSARTMDSDKYRIAEVRELILSALTWHDIPDGCYSSVRLLSRIVK